MSKVRTPNAFRNPKDAFDYILHSITATDPSKREALIKPHLQAFLMHPVIKDIVSQGEIPVPAPAKVAPPTTLELKQIQDTLSLLSKVVEHLTKGNPPSKHPVHSSCKKQKSGENTQHPYHTYSAVARSRPPNPSLMVDLAHREFPDGSRPQPELICDVLNKKLGEVTPLQVQLAAVR